MSDSRPSSITRSVRNSFNPEMECLPPDNIDKDISYELCEEVADDQNMEVKRDKNKKINQRNKGSAQGIKNDVSNKSSLSSLKPSKLTAKIKNERIDNDDIDVKIQKGLEKIQKLDKILVSKVEHEREVKRERLALEKNFLKQVQTMVEEKGPGNIVGYQQLLHLCAPTDRDNAEIIIDDVVQPIFATQIDDSNFDSQETENTNSEVGNDTARSSSEKVAKNPKKSKDFIKRNIKLASLAGETIALTDEEKKRLEELLADDNDLLVGENPFSTPSVTVGGFTFSPKQQQMIDNIDQKLREYLPSDEYEPILNQSQSSVSMSEKSINSADRCNDIKETDLLNDVQVVPAVECGEQVLREGFHERTTLQRLNDIERKLQDLRICAENTTHMEGIAPTVINPDLLRKLLDTNSRLTSSSKSICESFRTNSTIYRMDDDDDDDDDDDIEVCSMKSECMTITSVDGDEFD